MNNHNPCLFFTEIYTLKNPKPKSQYQFNEHNRHMSNTVQKLSLQSNRLKYKFLLSKKDQAKIVLKNLQLIVKVKCEIKEKMSELFKKATKICLFKKLLFTMENATAADSSQSNISRIYI